MIQRPIRTVSLGLGLMICVLCSCAGQRQLVTPVIKSILNEEVIALDADDIVNIMGRAGFSEKDVVDLGPRLRNDLAQSGGSQIIHRDKTLALYSVHGALVYVNTPTQGLFRYNTETKLFQ